MPFIVGKAGTGTGSYLTDENGSPVMLRCDTVWGLPIMAGDAGGAVTWQTDMDNYCATRASQGFNALYIAAVGTTNYSLSVTNVNGNTWDGVAPFIGGDLGSLNNTYWQRIDYLMTAAASNEMTVVMNLAPSYSWINTGGPQNGKTVAMWGNFGTAVGLRYGAAANLVWAIGDDYFDNLNTEMNACVDAVKAAETKVHLWWYENYAESTSREDMKTPTNKLAGGTRNSDINFAYSYNVGYLGIEDGWTESVTPIPVIRGDGYYEVASPGDATFMRIHMWWCLSSGARGYVYGNEEIWPWPPNALGNMTHERFSSTDFNNIANAFTGLTNWHKLVPDTSSAMVTAGRGTRAAEFVSGGSGGQYASGNTYVTASVTADKTLAVIYIPSNVTITVNGGAMLAGYGAKWMDPVTGATSVATIASTYNNPAANSLGGADWVLVLATPPYTTWTIP